MDNFMYIIYNSGSLYCCARVTAIGEPLKNMKCKVNEEICSIIPISITEVYDIIDEKYLEDNLYPSTLLVPVNDKESLRKLPCILEFESESSAKLFIKFGLDKYKKGDM